MHGVHLFSLALVGKRSISCQESWVTELCRESAKNIQHPWRDLLGTTVQKWWNC